MYQFFIMRFSLVSWLKFIKVICILLMVLGISIYNFHLRGWKPWNYFIETDYQKESILTCLGVIDRTVNGIWSYRRYSQKDIDDVEAGVKRFRDFHKIPGNLERQDGKCGNLTYAGLNWFRALCNPKGSTPCCFNNTCVYKTVPECQCTECYDFRPKVHAELADWTPDDPGCKILQFRTKDQVCNVLSNATLYFIGDSFLRQFYISLLGYFEKNDSANIFEEKTSPADIQKCDKHYRYIAECRHFIKHDMTECDSRTRVHCEEIYTSDKVDSVIRTIKHLSGKNNSWFIFGFGNHDNFNADFVQKKLIEPSLAEASKSEWPRLIWHEPHAAGVLKSPTAPLQLNPQRIKFNRQINDLLAKHNVPIFRFYNMTSPVLSYDGSHYGKGLNDVKVQILLNYILEQRHILKV